MQKYYSFHKGGHESIELPEQPTGMNIVQHDELHGQVCDLHGFIKQGSVPAISIPAKEEEKGELRTLEPLKTSRWRSKVDNDNFTAIRKSGVIKMTPYSNGYETITRHIVDLNPTYRLVGVGQRFVERNVGVTWNCYAYEVGVPTIKVNEKIVSVSDRFSTSIDYIDKDFPGIPRYYLGPDGSETKERNAAMASAVSDLSSGYDLLTEIGEFTETSAFLAKTLSKLHKPTESLKSAIEYYRWKPGHKIPKGLANQWMEYRYAVMPIYYSIQDIISVIGQSGSQYKTGRGQGKVSYVPPLERDMTRTHLFQDGTWNVVFKATGKARYADRAQRLLDQIQFNPFSTAWELTKFSWLIDWFVNIGDWVTAQSQNYLSFGEERIYCVSKRVSKAVNTSLYIPTNPSKNLALLTFPEGFWPKPDDDYKVKTVTNDPGGVFLLQTEVSETYDRELFNPGEVEFQFLPNLSVRRSLDAISLAIQKSSFRRFK